MNRIRNVGPRFQQGITLMELLIGLLIMAIMMTVAVPSYQDLSQRMAVRGGAFQMLEVFQQARSEALKREGEPVSIKFLQQNDGEWCARITTTPERCNHCNDLHGCDMDASSDSDSDWDWAKSPERAIIHGLDNKRMAEVKLSLSSSYNSGVVQLPDGRSGMTAGYTRFTVGQAAVACMMVSALGQAELCVPKGSPGIMGLSQCEAACP